MLLAPLLNSVSGIAIDLYAPSLPAIGKEFGVSPATVQQTISVTLIGYALGQIAFGLLADCLGRLRALYPGLVLFIAASLLAMFAPNIETLMAARALQGFAVGACQVVARAVLVDNLKGERFYVAVMYLSLAWGLGPVLAPFIGGLIQQVAGWRWNFFAYAAYSAVLLWLSLGLRESLPAARRMTWRHALGGYRIIGSHPPFLCAILVLGTSLGSFLVWNVIGPHLIQHTLGYGPTAFGFTALAAGLAYLMGTLVSRAMVRRLAPPRLMWAGILCSAAGANLAAYGPGDIWLPTLLAGILLINFGQGLLFPNVVARTMTLFPDRAGAAASLFGCGMMICAASASAVVGALDIASNASASICFAILCLLQASGLIGLLYRSTSESPFGGQP